MAGGGRIVQRGCGCRFLMKGKAMLIGNPCEAHAALVDCPPDRCPVCGGATVERPDAFLLAVYGADDPAGYKLVRECVNACQTLSRAVH